MVWIMWYEYLKFLSVFVILFWLDVRFVRSNDVIWIYCIFYDFVEFEEVVVVLWVCVYDLIYYS